MISYAQRRAASLARPPADLRPLLPSPVRQQGLRPLCVPFSLTAAHEVTRARMASSDVQMLAVEPVWQHCVRSGHAGHGGTTLDVGRAAVAAKGQTADSYWPYNDALGAGTEDDPAAVTRASWYKAGSFEVALVHDGIEPLLEDALAAGLPLVLIIELTREFEEPTAQGEIATPPVAAPLGDYHAVVTMGAATNTDGTSRRLLIRNTWGLGSMPGS